MNCVVDTLVINEDHIPTREQETEGTSPYGKCLAGLEKVKNLVILSQE